jgi:hypothetical protein
MAAAITVRREKLFNGTGARVPFSWSYEYTTPEPVTWPAGRTIPAGTFMAYGKNIASLRSMLRRKYGRDVVITETWR